jgi:YD repeat-containing protein
LFGQLNDADAFFNGNYDKVFVRNHNIKQVTVKTYINERNSLRFVLEFGSNGFLEKQTVFDSSDKKMDDYLFTYNKHGDQIERKNIAYRSNKTYIATFNKTYNGLQLVHETSSELPFVTTYTYDEKGKKVQSTVFLTPDTSMSAKRITLYTYDSEGKLTGGQETYIENKSSLPISAGKTTYIYDGAGNITDVIRKEKANYKLSYSADGLLQSKTTKMPEEFSKIQIVEKYSYTFWK